MAPAPDRFHCHGTQQLLAVGRVATAEQPLSTPVRAVDGVRGLSDACVGGAGTSKRIETTSASCCRRSRTGITYAPHPPHPPSSAAGRGRLQQVERENQGQLDELEVQFVSPFDEQVSLRR
jgi:hypothetical protein